MVNNMLDDETFEKLKEEARKYLRDEEIFSKAKEEAKLYLDNRTIKGGPFPESVAPGSPMKGEGLLPLSPYEIQSAVMSGKSLTQAEQEKAYLSSSGFAESKFTKPLSPLSGLPIPGLQPKPAEVALGLAQAVGYGAGLTVGLPSRIAAASLASSVKGGKLSFADFLLGRRHKGLIFKGKNQDGSPIIEEGEFRSFEDLPMGREAFIEAGFSPRAADVFGTGGELLIDTLTLAGTNKIMSQAMGAIGKASGAKIIADYQAGNISKTEALIRTAEAAKSGVVDSSTVENLLKIDRTTSEVITNSPELVQALSIRQRVIDETRKLNEMIASGSLNSAEAKNSIIRIGSLSQSSANAIDDALHVASTYPTKRSVFSFPAFKKNLKEPRLFDTVDEFQKAVEGGMPISKQQIVTYAGRVSGKATVETTQTIKELSALSSDTLANYSLPVREFISENMDTLESFAAKFSNPEDKISGWTSAFESWITGTPTKETMENIVPGLHDKLSSLFAHDESVNLFRASVQAQLKQNATSGVRAFWSGSLEGKNKSLWGNFLTNVVDSFYPLREMEQKLMGEKWFKVARPSSSPYMTARYYEALANTMTREAIVGTGIYSSGGTELMSQSLRDVFSYLAPGVKGRARNAIVKERLPIFTDWMIASRSTEMEARGIVSGLSSIQAGEILKSVSEDRQLRQVFSVAKKHFDDWTKSLKNVMLESGAVPPEIADAIFSSYDFYLPFSRSFIGSQGAATAMKKMKGGLAAPIHDPWETTIRNVNHFYEMAGQAKIARSFSQFSKVANARDYFVELPLQIPSGSIRGSLSAATKQEVKTILEDSYPTLSKMVDSATSDLFDDLANFSASISSLEQKTRTSKRIITFYQDGFKHRIHLEPEIAEAIKGISGQNVPWVIGCWTKAVKLGSVGLSLPFNLFFNLVRDGFTTAFRTEFGSRPFVSAAESAYRMFRGESISQFYDRAGGKLGQYVNSNPKTIKAMRNQLYRRFADEGSLILQPKLITEKILDSLTDFFGGFDKVSRLDEFKLALHEGEKRFGVATEDAVIYASQAAKKLTVDFSQMGRATRAISPYVPFFSASISGSSAFFNAIKNHPVRCMSLLSAMASADLALWWIYKDDPDYQRMSDHEHGMFFPIKIGHNQDGSARFLRIAKPQIFGESFSAPTAIFRSMYMKEPEIVKKAVAPLIQALTPPYFPAAVVPLFEGSTGISTYTGRPIVPEWMQNNIVDPTMRYKITTPKLAVKMGRYFGISPLMAEEMLNSVSGGAASGIMNTLEWLGGEIGIKAASPSIPDLVLSGISETMLTAYMKEQVSAHALPWARLPLVGRIFSHTDTPLEAINSIDYENEQSKQKYIRLMQQAIRSDLTFDERAKFSLDADYELSRIDLMTQWIGQYAGRTF